jgi:hypothetical protein
MYTVINQCCPNRCLAICSSTVVTLTQVVPLAQYLIIFTPFTISDVLSNLLQMTVCYRVDFFGYGFIFLAPDRINGSVGDLATGIGGKP